MRERICAVVVTFNRKELLRGCLKALHSQTKPLDHIIVVDNASTDGTGELLRSEYPFVEVIAAPENLGCSWGFHEGIKAAHAAKFDWIWAMDDDGHPEPLCLEMLLAHRTPRCVLVPIQRDPIRNTFYGAWAWRNREFNITDAVVRRQGCPTNAVFSFVGPLFHSCVVTQAGLPERDFFIWFDDVEYALRIRDLTGADIIHVPSAIINHPTREVNARRNPEPVWMLYYGVRNRTYSLVRVRRIPLEVFYHFYYQLRYLTADLIYERDRLDRLSARVRGVFDGLAGRLGKRAELSLR